MSEFPALTADEQEEIVKNALEASPNIPFHVFEKLFRTWLDILAGMDVQARKNLLSAYARGIAASPGRMAELHVDGLVTVFADLEPADRDILSDTICNIVRGLDTESRRRILLMTPDRARDLLGI